MLGDSFLAIFVLRFVSSMGIPAGSEPAIIGGGTLASDKVHKLLAIREPSYEFFHLSLVVVIVLAVVGEVMGSVVGYLTGLKGQRLAVDKWGKYLLPSDKDLDRAEMAFAKFVPFTAIGCTTWVTAQSLLGYSLGSTYDSLRKKLSYATSTVAVLVVAAIVAVTGLIWHHIRTMREERN